MNEQRTDTRSSGVPSSGLQRTEFAFQVGDDLTKYVTVEQHGREVTVRVRYGADVIMQEATHRLRTLGIAETIPDERSVRISYMTAFLFGLIRWRRSVRF